MRILDFASRSLDHHRGIPCGPYHENTQSLFLDLERQAEVLDDRDNLLAHALNNKALSGPDFFIRGEGTGCIQKKNSLPRP